MGQQVLDCQNASCERGGRRVLSNVSFSLESHQALIIRGPNGVGKSSLLRTLAGLVSLASGKIEIHGGVAERNVAEHAHYFGHLDALKPALTVIENLQFWRSFYEGVAYPVPAGPLPMQVEGALDALGIGHTAHLPAAYLSAGQRRRLSLARLLVVPRPLWLLDEPTSALDAASEETLVSLVNSHIKHGGMVVAATHLPLQLDNMIELNLGEIDDTTTGSDGKPAQSSGAPTAQSYWEDWD
ncbi:heme ABC exporter ATP-binding protein CcmA [Polycladidibacter stylochi]|uniref:heme ABC exporter ATP-binding protein CcmA n=1 Tax=Polycladidibacter stylochi TaxID=1807766 RepID=UPI0009E89C82|nr:heme ABC exporter ATP-binding protein CcmA [Pseudovibrio stylochi]